MKYNTVRKQELLALFSANPDKSYSVEDILALLVDMSQSTLYRLVASLHEEGYLRKVETENRATCYQYRDKENCSSHMHIRCRGCGQVEHLDEKTSEIIRNLVSNDSGFSTLSSTMLDGLCASCREDK